MERLGTEPSSSKFKNLDTVMVQGEDSNELEMTIANENGQDVHQGQGHNSIYEVSAIVQHAGETNIPPSTVQTAAPVLEKSMGVPRHQINQIPTQLNSDQVNSAGAQILKEILACPNLTKPKLNLAKDPNSSISPKTLSFADTPSRPAQDHSAGPITACLYPLELMGGVPCQRMCI